MARRLELSGRFALAKRPKWRGEFPAMAEDSFRFRCSKCRQLLGASFRRIGTVIACPRCGAELKVPRPEEQTATAGASRPGHGLTTQSRVPVSSSAPKSKSGGNALPSFMEEIAAAIPDDLATLRPEDIRVEAEFVGLVVTTSEGITPPAPAAKEPQSEPLPSDPVEVEAHFAQTPPPAEPRSVDPPVDPAIGAVLPAIKIETPTLLPPGRHLQAVSEVILQPATVLAWSLMVLLALPMAFLAGLLIGHFVWK